MTYFCKTIMSLACLILVAGCDQVSTSTPTPTPTPTPAAAKDPITADVDRMEAGIRIAAANKRIDELERQVAALQATPEKLDLELLANRVAALEAKVGGDASSPGTPLRKTTSEPGQTPRSSSKSDGPQPDKQKTSKSSLL